MKNMRWLLAIWLVLLLAAFGCGGGAGGATAVDPAGTNDVSTGIDVANQADADGPDSTGPDTTGPDAVEPDGAGLDVASPIDGGFDGAGPDIAANCPGGSGCPCASQSACDSGLCLETSSGARCAQLCTASCPAGYRCTAVPQGSDIVQACVASDARMCTPCLDNAACNPPGITDARCVPMGEAGAFCGVGCQTTADCPSGSTCQGTKDISGSAAKQCLPVDAVGAAAACTCSVNAMALAGSTTCSKSLTADGKSFICSGKAACVSAGQPATCKANEPTPESCNGQDDDCDGQTDEASCDDNNACTQDKCESSAAKCSHTNLTGSCDADGSACTQGDNCAGGACVAGAAIDCDDKNPCTKDGCDMAKGCTQVADDGKPCDADGSACTSGDVCLGGKCKQGQAVACDDGNPCTVDTCDAKTGQCSTKAEDDAVPCDDGTKCTSKDACKGGACKGAAVDCDDQNPCTDDVCDKQKGCSPQQLSGSPCSDDNPCTVGDLCDAGVCNPGGPKLCASPGPCVLASCDVTQKGACVFENVDPGTPCDDGSACTDKDGCTAGKCKGILKNCDDDNACTDDGCAAKLGCTNTANTSPCSDGNACTALDKCAGGKCAGLPLEPKNDCDDQNPCTTATCDPKQGCVQTPNLLTCDDGNPCTQGDQCSGGKCAAGTSTCGCQTDSDCAAKDDADLCNGVLYCDKSIAGQFACMTKPGSVVACNKDLDTACSQQACETSSGKCAAVAVLDGKSCDADGSVCTSADSCKAGTCKAGAAVSCDDKNPCTIDSCDQKSGCVYVANTAPCDADGDLCTVADTCQGKVCQAGAKKPCDDGEICTIDSCNAATGDCTFGGGPQDGKACDADGSVCTVSDSCKAGKCLPGQVKTCNDSNPCSDDSCTAKSGCVFAPNSQPCDDGNACTQNDLCAASQCVGKSVNPQVDCDDGQVCTTDGCDPKSGCSHGANLAQCDDGNPCTQGDLCAAKSCTSGSNVCGCQKDSDCAKEEDGDLCNGTLFCDTAKLPYTCKVKAATVVVCDKSKDSTCATNVCAAQTGKCAMVSATDGKGCDADSSVCTSGDDCQSGICKAGAAVPCDDNNPCTTDSCDAKTGCLNAANTSSCDADGSVCTVGDACKDKLCVAGAKKVCDDGNVCTDDSCDAKAGCGAVANQQGCSDGNACTGTDVCGSGKCAGQVVTCDDKDPCTADSCDAAKGCVAVALAEKAECGAGKSCIANVCVACEPGLSAKVDYPLASGGEGKLVVVVDVNGDGKPDMVSSNDSAGVLSVFINSGSGNFAAKVDYPAPGNGRYLAAGDLNKDGKPDIALSAFGGGKISVFLNQGSGKFPTYVEYSATGNLPYELTIADIDGNGANDIATAVEDAKAANVFLNKGDGTFWPASSYPAVTDTDGIAAGDLNGDGKPDLVLANVMAGSGKISVLVNKGAGTFASKVDYAVGDQPLALAMGDVNGDGKLDVAVANRGSNTVSVLMGNGDGTLTTKVDYGTGKNPQVRLLAVDMNGDAKLDIVTANVLDNTVSVLKNKGNGVFATKVDFPTGTKPFGVAVGDLDADGFGDIVTANSGANSLSVLKGGCSDGIPAGMAYVPAGSFWMGCVAGDSACSLAETPQHQLNLSAYFIDLTTVTVDAYSACVTASACTVPLGTNINDSYTWAAGNGQLPINGVDWVQADAFCKWKGKRLPTEAEWEKAARGGCEKYASPAACQNGQLYPWGNQTATCDFAVMKDASGPGCGIGVQPVGSRPNGKSPYGVLDMAGNLLQWTADWYDAGYYLGSPASDPKGPASGTERSLRGGNWGHPATAMRASKRWVNLPSYVSNTFGFRCVSNP